MLPHDTSTSVELMRGSTNSPRAHRATILFTPAKRLADLTRSVSLRTAPWMKPRLRRLRCNRWLAALFAVSALVALPLTIRRTTAELRIHRREVEVVPRFYNLPVSYPQECHPGKFNRIASRLQPEAVPQVRTTHDTACRDLAPSTIVSSTTICKSGNASRKV